MTTGQESAWFVIFSLWLTILTSHLTQFTDEPYAPKRRPTVKQIEVLIHRADGLTQEKIAEIMGVSRRTIRQHINALKKRGIEVP
ncbi:MAG: hypothetical protein CMG71_03660 [Candidatus Marinimicrobia bacterium]|nr:hypothetical protein [Candidatus Neomarinimicrobiota bacterium]